MARLYWMKLKRDFFKRHDIQVIEAMPNGKDYVLFYLKLLCESLDHEGNLRFSDTIPYNEEMLSAITHTNVDIVRGAMKVLISLGLVELFDDKTIYMSEVEKFIGSESESAERVRRNRELRGDSIPELSAPPQSSAQRQRKFRAKNACKEVQHVPLIEDYSNNTRYGGNYYIVMKRDKYRCCMCGSIEHLCVHHIDGYSEDKPQNNAENKMLVLCRKCHSQVHAGEEIPQEILESIDYFLDSNESNVTRNVTCNTESRVKSLDVSMYESKERENEDIHTNAGACAHVRKSYEQVMSECMISEAVRPTVWEFIKHCQLNGRTLTNEKLSGIFVEMDLRGYDDKARIDALNAAINGGYYDIKRD